MNINNIITVKEKTNKKGQNIALCPFCMENNTITQCKHFVKKWSLPYKSAFTGRKLEPDVYYFKQI